MPMVAVAALNRQTRHGIKVNDGPTGAVRGALTCTVAFTRARGSSKFFVADLFLNLNSVVMRAAILMPVCARTALAERVF